MCGIAGVYSFSGEPDKTGLARAAAQLQHRGPDDSSLFTHKQVGMVHTRLSIIDVAGGRQPLHDRGKNLSLVANGEIYNYIEIAQQLSQFSRYALTKSDCEAILQVYQADGLSGLDKLCGMFAFALYDASRDQLILARDRLGIKPLYYCRTSQGVFFASEIKALLALLNFTPDVNPDALVQFLQTQYSTGRETVFAGIHRVLPGEYLIIDADDIHHHRYWDLRQVASRDIDATTALHEFETLFNDVMSQHMRSDVPFGLFLSGGIDSSILLTALDRLGSPGLKTYSVGYEGVRMDDELADANALAKQYNSNHHALRVTRDDLFHRIVRSIWATDDLMRDYASLPTLLLSEVAARDVKVVFSGEGADEAFAGYRRYAPTFARWINHRLLQRGVPARGQWRNRNAQLTFTRGLSQCNFAKPLQALWHDSPRGWSTMQKRQYVDLSAALADNLFVKTDRLMMACGIEGRVPFADHRLVEFGLSLPDALKYRNQRGKWLLRQWAQRDLSRDHLAKPKRGFYVPIQEWLSSDFLQKLEMKLLTSRAIQHWFHRDGIKTIFTQHRRGQNCSREIWGLMQFSIWHRLFVQEPGRIPGNEEDPLEWI